jgi:predicted nicotinamide N-methyase
VSEIDAIEKSLRRRFRVKSTDATVGKRELAILHPESAEDLIDERDFERDERLPYWAELWPSALILAEHVAAMAGAGRSLIELGCGAGLVSTSAGLSGFDVTATDYYEDALRFATVNAVRNGAPVPRTLMLDWRDLPPTLPRFDVVLASDVLYERPYGPIVARAIEASLGTGGVAFLADPGRIGREDCIRSLGELGLGVVRRTECPFRHGSVRQTITIFEISRR